MKTLLLTAVTACCCTVGFASSAYAQSPAGANAPKFGVAVVDISYIFQKNQRFVDMRKTIKQEMDASEVEARSERETIVQLEQQRNGYNAGSAEYKKMDEELARKLADFNLKMTRLRKDFLEREAKIYYQAYLEINDAIKYYAAERNIGLVIRFNGDPVDPNRPESVQREINKPIVFQNQVDITPDILARLGRDSASSATRPQAPGSSIPRTR